MMPGVDRRGSVLVGYRLEKVEETVAQIGKALEGIDKSLSALASLEARHAAISDSIARAFTRLEEVELENKDRDGKILHIDGEFKKWFNRGVGVATVVSLIFTVGGGYMMNKLNSLDSIVALVPKLVEQQARNAKIDRAIMKKLKMDADLVIE